jgi:hypothetical protein
MSRMKYSREVGEVLEDRKRTYCSTPPSTSQTTAIMHQLKAFSTETFYTPE